MRNKLTLATIVVLTIFTLVAITLNTNTDVELQQLDIKTKQTEIDTLNQKIEDYNTRLEEAKGNKKELEKLEKEMQELKKQNEALQAKKNEEARLAQLNAQNAVYASSEALSGTCSDWIAQAGITDTANAVELINRESGCNPNAVNPSSGACGVAQELPCGKSGCSFGDGACQVKWMNQYVQSRYGSWAGAVQFHNQNNWY